MLLTAKRSPRYKLATISLSLLLLAACGPAENQASDETSLSPTAIPTKTIDVATATVSPFNENPAIVIQGSFGGRSRDIGINAIQTRDGGFALLGYTGSFGAGREDIYLVRLDESGNTLWSQTYGGSGTDNGWDLIEMQNGDFVILGFSNSFSDGEMDMLLVCTNAEGEMLWQENYGGQRDEYGWALAELESGGYALAGQTESGGSGGIDAQIIGVDENGQQLWQASFGGAEDDRVFAITRLADGGFVMVGTTESYGAGSRDAYIVKSSADGTFEWQQAIGEERDDVAHDVRATDDDGFIVTGYTRSFGAANYDTLLLKYSAAGELEWQSVFGGADEDRTISGLQTADGAYALAGYTRGFGAQNWDVYLAKTDGEGNLLWQEIFGGASDDSGYTVIENDEHDLFIVGHTYSTGLAGDFYFLKVSH